MIGRKSKNLAVALMCADWRLHQGRVDLNRRLAKALRVEGVDVIAVPGPDGLLKSERTSEWMVALDQIKLLIGAHEPVLLAVVAHQQCAGHPVSDEQHSADVVATAKALKNLTGFSGPVVALVAAYESDAKWRLERIGAA